MKLTKKGLIRLEQNFQKKLEKMESKRYCLLVEYFTNLLFESIIKNGVKIIVPKNFPKKFHKLNTEPDVKFCGTETKTIVKNIYKEYEILYLKIDTFGFFKLDSKSCVSSKDFIAFVCIPKVHTDYIKKQKKHIKIILQDYYYGANNWHISVIDQYNKDSSNNVLEEYDLLYPTKITEFHQKDKKWFDVCRNKYGINQTTINKAQHIILSHKQSQKNSYIVKNK